MGIFAVGREAEAAHRFQKPEALDGFALIDAVHKEQEDVIGNLDERWDRVTARGRVSEVEFVDGVIGQCELERFRNVWILWLGDAFQQVDEEPLNSKHRDNDTSFADRVRGKLLEAVWA